MTSPRPSSWFRRAGGVACLGLLLAGCDLIPLDDKADPADPAPDAGPLIPPPEEHLVDVRPQEWMGQLTDTLLLSQLSIPGTHDSAALIPNEFSKTQILSIAQQLDAGIRYLDVRCRHINDVFAIHHGPIFQELFFGDVLRDVYAFLDAHPTESVLMTVKQEHEPENPQGTFEEVFDKYVSENPAKWLLGDTIPSIAAAKGKIVLIRRFGATTTPKGIDATQWPDNATFSIDGNAKLEVQDHYQFECPLTEECFADIDEKWQNILDHYIRADDVDAAVLSINYTSATVSRSGAPSIPIMINGINPRLQAYFDEHTTGRYGVSAVDYMNEELATKIIRTNP